MLLPKYVYNIRVSHCVLGTFCFAFITVVTQNGRSMQPKAHVDAHFFMLFAHCCCRISSIIIYHKDHALVLIIHEHLTVAGVTIQFCEILQCCEQQLVNSSWCSALIRNGLVQ